ncbi:MAG: DUF6284 family protein [Actinomycetota bacterium]
MTLVLVATPDPEWREPTAAELAQLEAERPLLDAELAVVSAECAYIARPSIEARARVRRAEAALSRVCAAAVGREVPASLELAFASHSRDPRISEGEVA